MAKESRALRQVPLHESTFTVGSEGHHQPRAGAEQVRAGPRCRGE